jgi:putative transposase
MESKTPNNNIQIDEHLIQSQLKDVVRNTVEETLNSMLDAEADQLCGAERYQCTEVVKVQYHKDF